MNYELEQALKIVVKNGPNERSKVYAKAALTMAKALFVKGDYNGKKVAGGIPIKGEVPKSVNCMMQGGEMQTQLIYLLSSLQTWKGKKVERIKIILKKYR